MRLIGRFIGVRIWVLLVPLCAAPAFAADFPTWAYPPNLPDEPITSDKVHEVPGSTLKLTKRQIENVFSAPDWYPDSHPPMPEIVAHGHAPSIVACGVCHLPNGEGHPESAGLAGLTVDYIKSQMAAFKDGTRKSPITGKMVVFAKAASDAEIDAAAHYFASFKKQPWMEVVESDVAPKTRIGPHGETLIVAGGGNVARDVPIVTVPRDPELTALRASRLGYVAYVPPGSVAKGKAIVESGDGGKSIACAICHGAGLKGVGEIPLIAGRTPEQIYRALNDIKTGERHGDATAPMQAVVANLTADDMVAIAAYVGSLKP